MAQPAEGWKDRAASLRRLRDNGTITVVAARKGIGGAIRQVAERATNVFKLEVELAQLEVKKKVTSIGIGIGLGLGAAFVGLFGLLFMFATIAAALATFLSVWLALLIVTAVLFGLTGVLGLLAVGRLRKGSPPVPKEALREAKLTSEALKR
jgi:hypothetical protein